MAEELFTPPAADERVLSVDVECVADGPGHNDRAVSSVAVVDGAGNTVYTSPVKVRLTAEAEEERDGGGGGGGGREKERDLATTRAGGPWFLSSSFFFEGRSAYRLQRESALQ